MTKVVSMTIQSSHAWPVQMIYFLSRAMPDVKLVDQINIGSGPKRSFFLLSTSHHE